MLVVGGGRVPGAGAGPGSRASGAEAVLVVWRALVAFPRRRPRAKIAPTAPTTLIPIRTQPHHGRPPPPDALVSGVVCVCVACTLTDVEFVTDAVAAGCAAVFVTVCVCAGVVTVWAEVLVSFVAVSDLIEPVGVLTWAAALETALVAPCAALETVALVDPDPHALSGAVAIPSASAPRTSSIRDPKVIPGRLARDSDIADVAPVGGTYASSRWTSSSSAQFSCGRHVLAIRQACFRRGGAH